MEHTAVDAATMVDAARSLGRVSLDLEREVAEAASVVAAVSASWQGLAATAFVDGWGTVHHGARSVVAALEDSAGRLEIAAIAYAGQDDTSAAAIAGAV
ncbi:WXG100 family type VII secretion target [Rhodococcus sp. SORGH_AS_0303]|jgi:WXG100 family type VII secretion target|uniref:WXG100 family type VII secretion target n=1 Tax=Rhodococcus sp. SORGH_AS_0303 TaxID=3041753 RepID=UPI00278715D3|nr:WXG100 family type VII secretion target [Rhodococcus sp. SORGH_AS_0303]MDQ1200394.1 WXG100 family type VII secretion target [Rhodococcus sp. SORGH_AS_0303]